MSRVTVGPLAPELSSRFTAGCSALWMVLLVDEAISKKLPLYIRLCSRNEK